jgi:hypothetical protein
MNRIIIIFVLAVVSWAIVWVVISLVWWVLNDRAVDIAVPDDAVALVTHDPNPPMKTWRPTIPNSVGTTAITFGTATSACVSIPTAVTLNGGGGGDSVCRMP